MRQITVLIMAALMVLSCSQNQATFTVKGTISDSLSVTPGAVIVISDIMTDQKDTVQIVNGTFEYTGIASDSTIKKAALVTKARVRNMNFAQFIPEQGIININLNEPATVSGTPLNDAFVNFNDKIGDIYDNYLTKKKELSGTLSGEQELDAIKEAEESMKKQLINISKETYLANLNNAVGLTAIENIIYEFKTIAEYDEWVNKGSYFIKNYEPFAALRRYVVAGEKTAEGKMFTDFPGKTPDGKQTKLSDYVGKGKYVLVDFWASWCGPCKAEIPIIKEVYDQYSKRGLVVLGIAVWDGDNLKSKEVMKQLGMTWDQIFTGEDTASTDSYGITGIPHIILFGPDGTIVKRGLRGDMLKAVVADVMKK